ncbi:M42 family peptidase [bacterium]|nr:MAG: M42 family peptidase [bacterium]
MLDKLVNAFGPSGNENEVRELIKKEIEPYVDKIEVDAMGNLYAIKGENPEILVCAHMDEVGFMVVEINEDGTLKFLPVGGIDIRTVLGKRVKVGRNKIPGVIGSKAVHLLKPEEEKALPQWENLYMDCGFTKKDEAQKEISPGDYAVFDTEYTENGEYLIGKAFDDRIGCYITLELAKKNFPFPIAFVFTVQEEVGLRGASVVGNKLPVKIGLILEATAAGDFPQEKDLGRFPAPGKGPVITRLDKRCICDKELVDLLISIAEENGIPYQIKKPTVGGTDAGKIHLSREGVRCAVISVPARYIHSPVSVIHKKDVENTMKLAAKFLERTGGSR